MRGEALLLPFPHHIPFRKERSLRIANKELDLQVWTGQLLPSQAKSETMESFAVTPSLASLPPELIE